MQTSKLYFVLSLVLILSITGCPSPETPTTPLSPTSIAISTPTMDSIPIQPADLETVEGTFENQISLLEKNMPRSGCEGYVIPSKEEQDDFSNLVSLIQLKQFTEASELATTNHYRLNTYVDRGDDSALSYLLREQRPIQKGWGLYAFRVDSTSNLIIEAPHPLYDRRTPTIALDIYRVLDAHALLIAGAHRNANSDGSADVAHAPESIFHSVHESLAEEIQAKSDNAIVLQIHGFQTSKHQGYPQAVLGFGEDIPLPETTLAQSLESALSARGIEVGLCIDDIWRELCGRKNGQGAASDGAIFIHMELDERYAKMTKHSSLLYCKSLVDNHPSFGR